MSEQFERNTKETVVVPCSSWKPEPAFVSESSLKTRNWHDLLPLTDELGERVHAQIKIVRGVVTGL